ncbi:9635_t:CDS:1, partial [Acaulospora colombiana]
RHTTDASSYDGPSRYSSSSHGLDERYSLGPREYVESTARYQQPPESSLRDSNDGSMREGRPNSAPKEFEEEVTSPGSSRQRTTSLGTSSAASGTVLSPGQQHTSKMGYTLPPLSQSTAMDIDMDDPKVNKLPPIRALMYDSDDDRARPLHSHHLNLPQLSASTTSLSSSGIPATPNNPYLSTTPPRSQLGYNSSSPRMSVDRRDPSPPETNTNNVPTHFPKPTSAFSQPYWDAKEHVWRLNVQDSESAALPPVGNKVCWDARSGKWRVAYHAHLADTNSGFPVAFWSHDTEAWVLSSSA